MHPSRRSTANLNHSFLAATWVIAAVRAIRPGPFLSSAALRRKKKTDAQYPVAASLGPAGMKPTEAKKSTMGAG
jgi:hypothetical protein